MKKVILVILCLVNSKIVLANSQVSADCGYLYGAIELTPLDVVLSTRFFGMTVDLPRFRVPAR